MSRYRRSIHAKSAVARLASPARLRHQQLDPDITAYTSDQPCPASPISAITGNLLRLFGSSPAGSTQPSNLQLADFLPLRRALTN